MPELHKFGFDSSVRMGPLRCVVLPVFEYRGGFFFPFPFLLDCLLVFGILSVLEAFCDISSILVISFFDVVDCVGGYNAAVGLLPSSFFASVAV